MTIYTKTGDKGETSLFGGRRLLKSDLQVEAYGSVDELTSFLGLVGGKLKNKKERELLTSIQRDLHKIMGVLAGAATGRDDVNTLYAAAYKVSAKELEDKVRDFEDQINKLEKQLPRIHKFILSSGNEKEAWFHVLRTVCRRAERAVVRFFTSCKLSAVSCQPILKYLNRLSDLFFMLARKYNREGEILTSRV